MPKESDFSLVESPMPHAARGEVLVQALYLSVDPYVRGRLTGVTTYARGLDLGEVIVGGVVGRVLETNDPRYGPATSSKACSGGRSMPSRPPSRCAKSTPAMDRFRRPCTSSGCRA